MSVREKLTENFYRDEFECNCGCGFDDINLDLINRIQKVREEYGPINISSGCRCESWNKEVNGSVGSSHLKGYALDILCGNSRDRYRLLLKLNLFFDRIGVQREFIHVDTDAGKISESCWVY
jgi:zinc D-Ala-D-Ala carboxypeptidase